MLKVPVSLFAGTDDKVVDAESRSGRLPRDLQNSVLTMTPGNRAHDSVYDDARHKLNRSISY
jgi:hypothetical protein